MSCVQAAINHILTHKTMQYGIHIKLKLDENERVPTKITPILEMIFQGEMDLSVISDITEEIDENGNEFTTGVVFYNVDLDELPKNERLDTINDLDEIAANLRLLLDFKNNENIFFCQTYEY